MRFGPPPLLLLVLVVVVGRSFVRHAVSVFRSRYCSRRRPKALICLFGDFFFCKERNRERRCSASALSFSEVGESFGCRRAFLEASLSAAARDCFSLPLFVTVSDVPGVVLSLEIRFFGNQRMHA